MDQLDHHHRDHYAAGLQILFVRCIQKFKNFNADDKDRMRVVLLLDGQRCDKQGAGET